MISSYISHLLLDVGLCVSVYSAWGFPGGSVVKNLPANAGAMDSIPGWGRSPGEGNGYPLQYSCLENPMDRETWGGYSPRGCKRVGHDLVIKQQQQYSAWLFFFLILQEEKEIVMVAFYETKSTPSAWSRLLRQVQPARCNLWLR